MAVLRSPFELPAGRLLALDLGQARHGVAVCDETGTLASPLAVLRRHDTRSADFAEVQALVTREQVMGVLVGLPVQGQGQASAQQRWVQRYARRLAGALSVPVAFWDETLSSQDAAALVCKRGRQSLDDIAAALILQGFLEARQFQPGLGGT